MKFSDAFRETLHRHKLTGADIARDAGLTDAKISNFRNGSNLRIDTLERILAALPPKSREYMLQLVAEDPLSAVDDAD